MSPVRFRATLSDGQVFTGPIGGAGGMLGAGVPGYQTARRYAAARVRSLQHVQPYESVRIYPDHSAVSDGEPVRVPLAGTRFEVLP